MIGAPGTNETKILPALSANGIACACLCYSAVMFAFGFASPISDIKEHPSKYNHSECSEQNKIAQSENKDWNHDTSPFAD
jgi:hypothetical protein